VKDTSSDHENGEEDTENFFQHRINPFAKFDVLPIEQSSPGNARISQRSIMPLKCIARRLSIQSIERVNSFNNS
jgi:hypothetical protein